MQQRIDSAISTLQDEEETLLREKSKLDQQASELETALKRIRGARTALGVRSPGKSSGKKGAAKPSPDKQIVREVVIATLPDKSLQADELKTGVELQIKERGYSRMGLSLRLKEVLGEDQFIQSADGYHLVPNQDASSAEATPVVHQ